MMQALALMFREQEPDIFRIIRDLPGNPRIYEVACGFRDHVSFIVDRNFGIPAIMSITSSLGPLRPNPRVTMDYIDGADIITWWA